MEDMLSLVRAARQNHYKLSGLWGDVGAKLYSTGLRNTLRGFGRAGQQALATPGLTFRSMTTPGGLQRAGSEIAEHAQAAQRGGVATSPWATRATDPTKGLQSLLNDKSRYFQQAGQKPGWFQGVRNYINRGIERVNQTRYDAQLMGLRNTAGANPSAQQAKEIRRLEMLRGNARGNTAHLDPSRQRPSPTPTGGASAPQPAPQAAQQAAPNPAPQAAPNPAPNPAPQPAPQGGAPAPQGGGRGKKGRKGGPPQGNPPAPQGNPPAPQGGAPAPQGGAPAAPQGGAPAAPQGGAPASPPGSTGAPRGPSWGTGVDDANVWTNNYGAGHYGASANSPVLPPPATLRDVAHRETLDQMVRNYARQQRAMHPNLSPDDMTSAVSQFRQMMINKYGINASMLGNGGLNAGVSTRGWWRQNVFMNPFARNWRMQRAAHNMVHGTMNPANIMGGMTYGSHGVGQGASAGAAGIAGAAPGAAGATGSAGAGFSWDAAKNWMSANPIPTLGIAAGGGYLLAPSGNGGSPIVVSQ